jgi:hypothetical protein
MAFLDNSGDIILDAVLTDAGRARLARGDGSFKIVKYAYADDEIDYSKYDLNHASGSAYYDINILTTPVIEALTNNTSTMKSRLLSIPKTNLLYLPMMLLNEQDSSAEKRSATTSNTFFISCDEATDDFFTKQGVYATSGADQIPQGVFLSNQGTEKNSVIMTDQGLNTTAISSNFTIDPTLLETQYIVETDNRLGYIVNPAGQQQEYSYLDDDNIASYNFSSDSGLVDLTINENSNSPIQGPRGSRLSMRVNPSIELNSSTYLFTLLGTSGNSFTFEGGTGTFRRIDTNVRITGATTGYRITVPVSFLKIQ